MKLFFLFFVTGSIVYFTSGFSLLESFEWEAFKSDHGKVYQDETEEGIRYQIWFDNKRVIDEHNKKFEIGEVSYTMGLNKFSDLTTVERKNKIRCLKRKKSYETVDEDLNETHQDPTEEIPAAWDWSQQGAVTEAEDQEPCDICFAFSATGAIEGQLFRASGKLVSLSKQQIMDCGRSFDIGACNGDGGHETSVYEYVKKFGIESEASCKYEKKDMTCKHVEEKSVAKVGGYAEVLPVGDENALRIAVFKVGPIAVGIHVTDKFMKLEDGVFDEENCNGDIDHAVLVVGYGTENGKDYWLIKNSWGKTWGIKSDARLRGFGKMVRNKGNQCKIASDGSYPTGVTKKVEHQSLARYFLSLSMGNY